MLLLGIYPVAYHSLLYPPCIESGKCTKCVCVCIYILHTHTHTHTHIYIYNTYTHTHTHTLTESEQWMLHNNVLNIKRMKIQLKNKLASRPTHDFTEACKKHKSYFSCCLRKNLFSWQHTIGDTEVSMLTMHHLSPYFIPLCLFSPTHPHFHPLPTLMFTENHCICMYYWKILFYICVLTFLYFKWYCIDLSHFLPTQ